MNIFKILGKIRAILGQLTDWLNQGRDAGLWVDHRNGTIYEGERRNKKDILY